MVEDTLYRKAYYYTADDFKLGICLLVIVVLCCPRFSFCHRFCAFGTHLTMVLHLSCPFFNLTFSGMTVEESAVSQKIKHAKPIFTSAVANIRVCLPPLHKQCMHAQYQSEWRRSFRELLEFIFVGTHSDVLASIGLWQYS